MTTPSNRRQTATLRRIVAGAVTGTGVAIAVSLGVGIAPAHADVIDALAQEYTLGSGGGHVSSLLKEVVTLRAQGIPPKPGDLIAVQDAMNRRPNQMPLIDALSATVAHQRKVQSQMAGMTGQGQPGIGIGVNTEPWNPSGNPMIQDNPAFPMPGRS